MPKPSPSTRKSQFGDPGPSRPVGFGSVFWLDLGVPMSRLYGNRWDLSGLRAARHPLVPKVRIGVNPKHGSSPGMTGE